jgi:hypothetical protein
MAMFKAFKPSGMEKIARSMGYQGDMQGFQNFLATDPARQQQMDMYTNKAMQMAKGGVVKMQDGGFMGPGGGDSPPQPYYVLVAGGAGEGASTKRIRIGSKEDTSEARKAAVGTEKALNAPDNARNIYAHSNIKPYDVRLAEYNAALAAQQQQQNQPAPAPAPAPQQPSDPTSLYSSQLADNMAGTPTPFGTSFRPDATPPIYGTAFTDNQGQTLVNAPTVQRAVAGQPIPQGAPTQISGPFGAQLMPVQQFATGGVVTNPSGTQAGTPTVTEPTTPTGNEPAIGQFSVEQMYQPGVPVGGTTIAAETPYDPSQDIAAGTGTVTGTFDLPTEEAITSQADAPTQTQANTMQAATAAPGVDAAMNATSAAQANPQDPRSQVTAAQQTASSVGNLQAAQGNAVLINNPVQRQIQQGELISGTGVDATKAAQVTAQTQAAAATANPSAQTMVANQLDGLMQQFQGANPPAWAAGAMRSATAAMAARGMGASSLAGQAIVQAAMESALPIAMADAQTVAKFESQNLSNRQQSAMLAAEQRARFMGQEFDQAFQAKVMNASKISDIANQNFTAEQQVQLENSRAANTMNLQNLSNSQALVMAEAAALAQLDVSNLNNRQQAAVQNAQNFLQVDMANLSNRQQTELFKAQQRTQALFTDQAAENAARQFNASSQNQVDQFFANLSSQVSQFNATQQNAQSQFNAGQTNSLMQVKQILLSVLMLS